MTQVSKHQLQPEMSALIYKEFCGFVGKVPSGAEIQEFFNDFLTSTEQTMLSKRFMIMVLLMRGHSVEQVKDTLFVSNSAVMGVSSWLKNATQSTKKGLNRLNKEKDWEVFFDQIEAVLDKLPPGKYRNWQQVGKEKMIRLKSRQVRGRLD